MTESYFRTAFEFLSFDTLVFGIERRKSSHDFLLMISSAENLSILRTPI
jgi:hypothetical protein